MVSQRQIKSVTACASSGVGGRAVKPLGNSIFIFHLKRARARESALYETRYSAGLPTCPRVHTAAVRRRDFRNPLRDPLTEPLIDRVRQRWCATAQARCRARATDAARRGSA